MVKRIVPTVIVAFIVALALSGGPVFAQVGTLPSIIAVGVGYIVVDADEVVLSLGVESSAAEAKQATDEQQTIINTIRDRIQQLKVNDVKVAPGGISVWQQRSAGRPVTYRANSIVNIILPAKADIGPIIDAAISSGGNGGTTTLHGVRFQSTAIDAAVVKARAAAVADAMAKASEISKATEMRVVTIRRVNDTNKVHIYNPSDPLLAELGARVAEPPVSIERGQLLVQYEVTVEFDVASI